MAARVKSIPSPVGGWNARDAYAGMPENDAVKLENWFPSDGACVLRKGYTTHQDNLSDWVDTLAIYDVGTEQLIAGVNGTLRNITSGNTELATGFTSDRWYYATLDGTMGLANGSDDPQTYNGTTVSSMTLTGPTLSDVIGVQVFKSRSYFWEEGEQSFWYSPVNQMGGTVTEFNLGNVANITGELTTMATWTRDGGDGADDLAVFIFSHGDVLIYQGSDPGEATDWALIGHYKIASPIGRRCVLDFGGDVVIITVDGFVRLSEVLMRRKPSLSDKIDPAIALAAEIGKNLDGWEAVDFPAANMVLFNVPTSSSMSDQYVLNTNTGAWCQFTGWNARSWVQFNDLIYFGGNGAVYKAWSGKVDGTDAINADAICAWEYFKGSNLKQITAIQNSLTANGTLDLSVSAEADFKIGAQPTANLSTGSSSSPWGSPWGSPWSTSAEVFNPIKSVAAVGRALANRLVLSTKQHTVTWYSTTYFYKEGGFL